MQPPGLLTSRKWVEMAPFKGFPEGKVRQTPIPEPFFSELLAEIDDLAELKLTVYVFWRLNRTEGVFRYLLRDDIKGDARFMSGLGDDTRQAEAALDAALEKALSRGTLLRAAIERGKREESYYFLNSAKGRAALRVIAKGDWRFTDGAELQIMLGDEPPNIFELYEEHIGVLTPMIADALREAEDTYPPSWIEDAFRIAVENNARNWRYISAILNRWQVEGRDEREDRRDTEKARRRYAEE
jgi:DNA replication protein